MKKNKLKGLAVVMSVAMAATTLAAVPTTAQASTNSTLAGMNNAVMSGWQDFFNAKREMFNKVTAQITKQIKLVVDGKTIFVNSRSSISEIIEQDGVVMLNVLALPRAYKVPYSDITNNGDTLEITYANATMTFTVGSATCQVVKSGIHSELTLDTAVVRKNHQIYIPAANLAEALGYTADTSQNYVSVTTEIDNVVETTHGLVAGVDSEAEDVTVYKGIPYATADRWESPQEAEDWDGVQVCDTFSAICPQSTTAYGDFQQEFYDDPYPEMSEDCLYLNVWAPDDAEGQDLPVMVYLHGGGNGSGWSYEKEFDGDSIAESGCILVTINYRLGAFGFLAAEDLEDENGCSGNYGLQDQIAAFQWVQDNIEAFGGDPDNVTMFGQSAGAYDVTVLSCSDKMEGLVDRAIIQSDYMSYSTETSLEDMEANGAAWAEGLGMTFDELKEVDAMDLYDMSSSLSYGVCTDGYVLTDTQKNIFDNGDYLDISYMSGSNESEGVYFANSKITLAEKQLELGRTPAYTYLFSHFMPGIDDPSSTCYGSFHSSECWYIFSTLDRCWRASLYDDTDYAVSDMMTAYWTNFAKTGDPNGEGLDEWAPYTEENKNVQDLDVIDVDPSTPVAVDGGMITGTSSDDGEVAIYRGIPYAAAPVGDLRWKAPQDVESWNGIKSCDTWGACPMQDWADFSAFWMACYSEEYEIVPGVDTISEDCLYLNVWSQSGESQKKDRPVIVYIHGGGYGQGSGSIACYDGEQIAKDGAVYVTINYRLGIFGFLTTPELDAESETGTSGNYALLDTVKALQWVNDNIEQFGGDPDNITIVGQSAGGMSIDFMVQSPLAEGLFENAVVLSGNYIRAGRSSAITTKESAQESFAASYPDVTLEELRAMSAEDVYDNYSLSGNVVVDGYVLPNDTTTDMVSGNYNGVNLLLSTVEGDVSALGYLVTDRPDTVEEYETWVQENLGDYADDVLALYPAESDEDAYAQYAQVNIDRQLVSYEIYAEMCADANKNSFICYFTHELPNDDGGHYGAFHTSDVAYWLGTYTLRESANTDMDAAISNAMQQYLVNFAAYGDPNGEGVAEWPQYEEGTYNYLHIGDNTYDSVSISQEKGDFWRAYYNETSLGGVLN